MGTDANIIRIYDIPITLPKTIPIPYPEPAKEPEKEPAITKRT